MACVRTAYQRLFVARGSDLGAAALCVRERGAWTFETEVLEKKLDELAVSVKNWRKWLCGKDRLYRVFLDAAQLHESAESVPSRPGDVPAGSSDAKQPPKIETMCGRSINGCARRTRPLIPARRSGQGRHLGLQATTHRCLIPAIARRRLRQIRPTLLKGL